jgi:hypothetical protein
MNFKLLQAFQELALTQATILAVSRFITAEPAGTFARHAFEDLRHDLEIKEREQHVAIYELVNGKELE